MSRRIIPKAFRKTIMEKNPPTSSETAPGILIETQDQTVSEDDAKLILTNDQHERHMKAIADLNEQMKMRK